MVTFIVRGPWYNDHEISDKISRRHVETFNVEKSFVFKLNIWRLRHWIIFVLKTSWAVLNG